MMRSLPLWCLAVALSVIANASADDPLPRPNLGEIIRLDPGLDELLAPDAKIEVLASGLDWSEGPVWFEPEKCILFSDVPRNKVLKWKAGDGLSTFLEPSGYTGRGEYSREPGSNGLATGPGGLLYFCEHGDRRVSVLTKGGGKRTVADQFEGKRFSSPNDLCFDRAGNLYLTDPPYGLPDGPGDRRNREIEYNGVYRVGTDGKVTLLTSKMTFPNGIALSPDERKLYVAQSDRSAALWMVFDLREDGTAGEGKVLADATAMYADRSIRGGPDGMKVDAKGNLWATGPGGVHIMTPEGKLLGRIQTFMANGNCCFGDDGSMLYICGDAFLLRVQTRTRGSGFAATPAPAPR